MRLEGMENLAFQFATRRKRFCANLCKAGSLTLAVTAFVFASPQAAEAATATTTFAVTATVLPSCTVTATALAFGNYNPLSGTPTDGTSTITVNCTTGTSYTVGLNAGGTSGATVTTRQMLLSTNALNYALYRDSGHTNNWGNTPGTDTPASAPATTTAAALTVYGRIPALQNVPAGSYTDTVTVTVNY
ncbi:spore coat protein U-like protein [Novosphingobium sp. PhB165]|uniref:Csu type fimbrial protein n=1 Tax=Novosphingobium sp. PhB165 TaxID=2485105 RepID=UPI0010D37DEC|nr:spore coat U domain-containing protein [Novosphingobium sp. PhB165]TCM19654.1 spore coat protein U-like protein [Novosphingobium sp. PhB165]